MILAQWHNLLRQTQIPEATGVQFVKSQAFQTTTPNTVNFTLTGIQSGDLVLATLSSDTNNFSSISGWTTIADAGGIHDAAFYYRFSTGTSINITSGDDRCNVILTAFRNVDSTTPLDVTPPSVVSVSNTQTTPASITTTSDGCMLVVQLGVDDIDATSTTSPPTGYTLGASSFDEFLDGDEGDPSSAFIFYKEQTTSGTESPSTITYSTGGSEHSHCLTLALRPA